MSTVYNTPRGRTYDPMQVELWEWDGTGPLGRVELSEKIEVTWADRTSGTVVLDTPLTWLTRQCLPADGRVLVVVTLNGKRHISSVVEAQPYADADSRNDPRIRITTASSWSLLDGELIPPVPDQPLNLQQSAEEYVLTDRLETVIKRLVQIGADRVGHPIAVMPDARRGPQVTIRSRNDTVADLVEKALVGTGYRLKLDAWLPGDDPIGQLSLTRPTIVADVVPYREQPGLVWSGLSEDLDQWKLTHSRPTKTRLIVGDRGEKTEQKFVQVVSSTEPVSPWARREGYAGASSEGQILQDVGEAELAQAAGSVDLDATVTPATAWEFGTDGKFPRQYDVGDVATVVLPGVGEISQVITEVTAVLTPVSMTVTPKVSTPDTKDRSLYTTVMELDKKLDEQSRR
ncbi:hypothetical protein CFAL_12075 (plasmid) [Corynebacterium falsenii DSM 44353]|uniref:Gp37-like protein n=1 Tax=Corynebacterium falsenii TaxID=108486 RepID=UPI0003E9291D|nr:siphovirus ReqiPepy6 Gp37-like family protein [Corynebacterium falsenii]AHI04367.1 hypothetical protein CFAL_09645 [Corynebacterium falsenii DSM 44353]AHI04492.1 hypothetical protein CFAL_12075 [Corynebacterium falsenii DSM 44353]UBI04574.1 siphovirus ReqiPepy6 Gp37-like family protein [Corynebacterium falsenii]